MIPLFAACLKFSQVESSLGQKSGWENVVSVAVFDVGDNART